MSESNPEQTEQEQPQTEEQPSGDTNIEGDQVVVNQAPDGGGVDNNEAEPAPDGDSSK